MRAHARIVGIHAVTIETEAIVKMEKLQRKRRIVNETENQKRARLDRRNQRDREKRKSETAEEKRKRLEKRRDRDRARRRAESTADKEKRLEKKRHIVETETPEKRAERQVWQYTR